MDPIDVRSLLSQALRLDMIGPSAATGLDEVIDRAPTRWYVAGFLAPWDAPADQKEDEEAQDELPLTSGQSDDDEDDGAGREAQAAKRGRFPSSMGLSVLVPLDLTELKIAATWGDYRPVVDDKGAATGQWQREPRHGEVTVRLNAEKADPPRFDASDDGLEVVVSVRRIRRPGDLRGLPADTRAVSVFLVNRHQPINGKGDLKDQAFVFQAALVVEGDRPFVPRPNPRGGKSDDYDERVADLQFRDAREFAVGHGVSTRSVVAGGACQRVETTWMPEYEVERVEASRIDDVQLGMQALADLADASAAATALTPLVTSYRAWIAAQRREAPKGAEQGEVSVSAHVEARKSGRTSA